MAGPADPERARALEQWSDDYTAAITAHLKALADGGDAYAQLALAMMWPLAPAGAGGPGDSPEEAGALDRARAEAIMEAARQAPDDPMVAWMESQLCPAEVAGCDPAAALARLQRLEPDNAANWLPSLQDAWRDGDPAAIDRYLGLAAAAEHFDFRYGDVAALMTEATRDVPLPPLDADLRKAMGRGSGLDAPISDEALRAQWATAHAGAHGLPAVSGVMAACKPGSGQAMPAQRVRDCSAIMARMAVGKTLIERALGLTGMVRLTAGQPQGAYWREQLRRYYWMYSQVPSDGGAVPGYWDTHVYQGEVAALEYYLRMHGRLDPPSGWLPLDPRQRSLVITGKAPAHG